MRERRKLAHERTTAIVEQMRLERGPEQNRSGADPLGELAEHLKRPIICQMRVVDQ